MKQINTFVGIDISKLTLDIRVIGQVSDQFEITNDRKSVKKLIARYKSQEQTLCFCMENTGRYTMALLSELAMHDFAVYVISPLHLARSLGLSRGKNDQVDALRIAQFTKNNYSGMQQWTPPRQVILELQMLLTERKRLVKWKREIKASSKELVYFEKSPALKVAITINRQLLNTIETELSKIEKAIEQVVATDPLLAEQAKLLTSITGVGKVLTSYLIVKTNEFKTLNDPRKIACYAGVVPFEHTSGTSLRGKNRLSGYADKQLKTLLHLSAMSVIRLEGELRDYYRRKVAEGKNKMSVLNAVRNKLVHRICAVVRDQRIYKPNLEMS